MTGNLTIDAAGMTAIDLTALQTVGGDLSFDGFSGSAIAGADLG